MYIVNRGRLHVVADNGKTVLATLKPGKLIDTKSAFKYTAEPYVCDQHTVRSRCVDSFSQTVSIVLPLKAFKLRQVPQVQHSDKKTLK